MHDNSTNPERISIALAGKGLVGANLLFSSNATGGRMGLPAKLPVPTRPPRIGSAITEALSLFRLAVLSGDAEREREAAAKTGSVVGWEIAQAHAVASGYTRHP